MEAIIIHPENIEQSRTIKAVLKALNVRFENEMIASNKKSNQEFITELKEAVYEVNLIKAGKLKGRPATDLLNEL